MRLAPVAGGMAALFVIGLIGRRSPRGVGPGRTVRAAFRMLPPDVQEAITAALRADEDSIQALVPTPAEGPPYLFVVRSDQTPIFGPLRELVWARPDVLGVVFDRRWMGERRSKPQSGQAGRRRAERRRPAPERSWTQLGFVLVAPAAPSRPLPAPSVGPPSRPAVSLEQAESAGAVVRRPRFGRRAMPFGATGLGLWILLLFGAVSVADLYLRSSDRSAKVAEFTPSAGSTTARPSAPTATAGPEPSPPARTAPEPRASRLAPRDRPPVTARAPAPEEPASGVGLPVDRCATPPSPTVALRDGEVLGVWVGVKIAADSQPPRCLFVIERADGALWVVNSSRVQIRPR